MVTIDDWRPYFPKPIPRDQQITALNEIITFFESNLYETQIFLLNAPTGVGKSAIGYTIAKYFYAKYGFGANYLANDKFLQKQLISDFPDMKPTYGRNNFHCLRNDQSCDLGVCQMEGNLHEDEVEEKCPHSPVRGYGTFETIDGKNAEKDAIDTEKVNYEFHYSSDKLHDHFVRFVPSIWFSGDPHCPYWETKVTAVHSPLVLHNYAYYLLENSYIKDFAKRWLIICDEGHKIEDVIMGFVSFTLYRKTLQLLRIPIEMSPVSFPEWVKRIITMNTYLNSSEFMNNALGLPNYEQVITKRNEILSKVQNLLELNEQEWIIEYKYDENESKKHNRTLDDNGDVVANTETESLSSAVVFKPIEIKKYVFQTLFRSGVKFLVMSGTLLSKPKMMDTLGLNDWDLLGQVRYLEVGSPFEIKNRLFYFIPVASMNFQNTESSLDAMISIVQTILQKHADQKGIIHTKSYRLATMLKERLHEPRILVHDTKSRKDMIDAFLEDQTHHYVLTSPSIEEGLDLYDDRCRFIIILKVPYLNLGDDQIKKRMQRDNEWYQWKTIQTILQMAGRGVRHQQDWCVTYMLDANFERLLQYYREYFPQWFLDAIIKQTPEEFFVENV